jgi:hypothetical protein
MRQAFLVHSRQVYEDLQRNLSCLVFWQYAILVEVSSQAPMIAVLHYNEERLGSSVQSLYHP